MTEDEKLMRMMEISKEDFYKRKEIEEDKKMHFMLPEALKKAKEISEIDNNDLMNYLKNNFLI